MGQPSGPKRLKTRLIKGGVPPSSFGGFTRGWGNPCGEVFEASPRLSDRVDKSV